MSMELNFTIKQRQSLSLRQQQAAAVLQMGRQELDNYIHQAILENPLLDYEESKKEEYEDYDMIAKIEWLKETDKQNLTYYEQDNDKGDDDGIANIGGVTEEGLREYILSQFYTKKLDLRKERILEYLVFSLDDNGYFKEEISSVIEVLHVMEEEVRECLDLLKSAEPAGIGASSIEECLLLQLDRKGEEAPIARKMISNHLDLLGNNQLSLLAKELSISMGELLENYRLIQELNPKPGNGFSNRENLKYIRPDVTVVKFSDRFELILNDASTQIMIHSYYCKMLKEEIDTETKSYIRKKLNQAKWTIQCVQQRSSTLRVVARALMQCQMAFFEHGKGHLVPVSMHQIAEMVGMHESTISRAVKDKYLQCSWGIYPMTYFFVKKLKDGIGSSGTALHAKDKLREIIEKENKKSPLSDQKIADLLKEHGIEISRRTVAKYREDLGILDKGKRKQYE